MKTKKSRTILSAIKKTKKQKSDERRFLSVPLGGAAGAGVDIKQQQKNHTKTQFGWTSCLLSKSRS